MAKCAETVIKKALPSLIKRVLSLTMMEVRCNNVEWK